MTPNERAEADYIYGDGELAERFAMSWLQANGVASAIARRATIVGGLTQQERDELLNRTAETEGQIDSYGELLANDRRAIERYLTFPAESGKQVR